MVIVVLIILPLGLVNVFFAFHGLDCRSNVLPERVKFSVQFIIKIPQFQKCLRNLRSSREHDKELEVPNNASRSSPLTSNCFLGQPLSFTYREKSKLLATIISD